jgi:hypothetical protein
MPQFTSKIDAKVIGSFIAGTLVNVTNNIQVNYKAVTITSDGKVASCACSSFAAEVNTGTDAIKRSDWIYDFLAS